MSRLGIPTLAEFKEATSIPKSAIPVKRLVTGRGSDLALVDSAISEWDVACKSVSPQAMFRALNHLSKACTLYLKNHAGKNTTLANRRKAAVRGLLKLTINALGSLNKGQGAFAENKSKAIFSGNLQGKTTELFGGYKHEKQSYVQTGKRFAASASALHDDIEDFHNASFATFAQAYTTATDGLSQMGVEGFQVTYLTKNQRMQYLAIPHDGTFRRPDGTPLNSTGTSFASGATVRSGDMWSMDKYGNLFVKDVKAIGSRMFNHSSFNAGNEVICAGVIVFNPGGVLVYLDNNSGHYQPNAETVRSALDFLRGENISLNGVRVGLVKSDGSGMVNYQAATVLGTPNINPMTLAGDWNPANNAALNLPTDISA